MGAKMGPKNEKKTTLKHPDNYKKVMKMRKHIERTLDKYIIVVRTWINKHTSACLFDIYMYI